LIDDNFEFVATGITYIQYPSRFVWYRSGGVASQNCEYLTILTKRCRGLCLKCQERRAVNIRIIDSIGVSNQLNVKWY